MPHLGPSGILGALDFGHSRRFATREARRFAGDLYPGPVLMPRGLLRALDPLLAVALGPARRRSEVFQASWEGMLRGRPDGPLLLVAWESAAAGELRHADLRRLLELFPDPPPTEPATREELLGWLRPRVRVMARLTLSLAQRPDALPAAEDLGCGLVLTRILVGLGPALARGRVPLPAADLEAAGVSREELLRMVPTPAVRRLLDRECDAVEHLIASGLPVCDQVGARLRRGLRAAALRARLLLGRFRDPDYDPLRRAPTLTAGERWRCAVRAWRPLAPPPPGRP